MLLTKERNPLPETFMRMMLKHRLTHMTGFLFIAVLCTIMSFILIHSVADKDLAFLDSNNAHSNNVHENGNIINISKSFSTIVSLKAELKTNKVSLRKWDIIDFQNDSNPHGFKCDWVPFKPSTGNNIASSKDIVICVHPFHDIVSDGIRGNHRWNDCDVLPSQWEQSMINHHADSELSSAKTSKISNHPIYLEIGANIGSCVMEMLFSTDAPIIAFEPNPKNWFPLRETMRRLDKSYQDRVVLLPIALGATESNNTIHAASNNMGNSQVGTAIKDLDILGQQFLVEDQFEIQVDRLDNVLELLLGPDHDIPLVKMDAQGFECEILKGMGQHVADKIRHVHFEKADLFLKPHNCEDLLERFHEYGFNIYGNNNVLIDPSAYHQPMSSYNLDAKRPNRNILVKAQA